MRPFSTRAILAVAALGLAATAVRAETIYAVTDTGSLLTNGSLVAFDSASPSSLTTVGALSGFLTGHVVRGIDFRPADGLLYAISTDAATNSIGQLYTVNLATGALSTVGSTVALAGNSSARVSIDFNPVVDRLRVVTGTTQNYRINPNDGTLAARDTDLARDASYPNATVLLMADAAYSNNVAGASTTTLYGYDYFADHLTTIGGVNGVPSPNGGLVFDVGPSGIVAASASLGFDISGATGIGYINADTLSSGGLDAFFSVNLASGALTSLGSTGVSLLDISVRPTATAVAPEPASIALLAVGALGPLALRRRRPRR